MRDVLTEKQFSEHFEILGINDETITSEKNVLDVWKSRTNNR